MDLNDETPKEFVKIAISKKELRCLQEIVKGNDDGSYLDKWQLAVKVDHSATIDALVFTLRHMIQKGFIQKEKTKVLRNSKWRVVFSATAVGRATAGHYSSYHLDNF